LDARDFDLMEELEVREPGIGNWLYKITHGGKTKKEVEAAKKAKAAAKAAATEEAREFDDEFDDLMSREVELD